MLASKFVLERILTRLKEKNHARVKELLAKYPKDEELQKAGKDIAAYFRKPSPSKLKEIENLQKEPIKPLRGWSSSVADTMSIR